MMVDGIEAYRATGTRLALSALLGWLNQHGPTDVRIEPLGLGPLYARIHGG